MHKKYNILFLLIACIFTACTPRAVREAQCVVAQADSLRAAGGMYSDSLQMAQAYKTLGSLSLFNFHFSTSYAHACYHYGRLLREKENPVEAMQCFINATHSRTRDYHILGRVYSNIGEIAHLASEFPLSYDMFERSADMFLQSGDSIAYFYALNDMAFELAELGEKEETCSLIDSIAYSSTDEALIAKTWETKAELYRVIGQYDSSIYCAKELQQLGYIEANSILIMAQDYDELGKKDSALIYAEMVLSASYASYQNKFNALYIILHGDSTLSAEDIYEFASQREDIRYYEYEPQKEKWILAIQLLNEDLTRKPNISWLYAIIFTLIVVGIIVTIYVHRKRRKQQLLTQQIDVLQDKLVERHSQLKEHQENRLKHIQENCEWFVKSKEIRILLQKEDYQKVCELINTHFTMLADKLKNTGRLNEKDVCLCIFVMDGTLTEKQIADILYYSHNTIRSIKRYVAKKIGTTSANLQSFLLKIATE